MPPTRLILASASPRRADLLRSLGWTFVVRPAGIDESVGADEDPSRAVERLARDKAASVAAAVTEDDRPAVVLAADTAVVVDGNALGKPVDDEDAAAMLRRLSGRDHVVATGVAVRDVPGNRTASIVDRTTVTIRPLDEAWIRWYVGTGEPRDKAGAYGIQGRGVLLAERLRGSWSNVVGLPMERLPGLLAAIGIDARRPPFSR